MVGGHGGGRGAPQGTAAGAKSMGIGRDKGERGAAMGTTRVVGTIGAQL